MAKFKHFTTRNALSKQQNSPERIYPRDMYAVLQPLWNSKAFFSGWPEVHLPPKEILDQFLDVCYHASMTTEEGRPTVFRVAFIDSTAKVSPQEGSVTPVTKYTFVEPIPFTVAELRRLAPVADPRSVLVAVELIDGCLQIYGLIDIGIALWEMARHERIMGHSSPEALIVMSSRPGELSISRGDRSIARLRDGNLVRPSDGVLLRGPVADFFADASDQFIVNACSLSDINTDPAEDDGLCFAHMQFVESVLLYTAELKHGGTLLFVPEQMTHADPRLLGRVNIKYALSSTRPRDVLVSAMAARLNRNRAADKIESRRTVKKELIEELECYDFEQQNYEDATRDAARFIASLTAVDGAVILTDMFRIIGFGAEVIASFSGADKVHIAQDAEGNNTEEASFVGYGTRHRSAFRFAASMESSVAFIMSQDGGIKAVRQVGPKLLMWPYFQIGFVSALS